MNSSFLTRRLSKRRGFTILELIVALLVIGIVASISVGKIHDLIVQQRVYRASNDIQTNVEAAWALAARNRRPIRIYWVAATSQMKITDRAGTTTYRKASLGADPYGLAAGTVTFSSSPIEIYPDGLGSDTLLITLSTTSPAVTKRIWVSRAGLVQQRAVP
jgi:prepilin-type N-terminal cleavage/methylation domain-containing protein